MSRLPHSLNLVLMVLTCALVSSPAFAQGASNSSITGVVVDTEGGVIPGATISVKNDDHRHVHRRSGRERRVHDPGLIAGKYTVTVPCRASRPRSSKAWSSRLARRPTCGPSWKSAASPRPSRSKARRDDPDAVVAASHNHRHEPDREAAGGQPQHARLRAVPAGRPDAGRHPRLDGRTACRRARSTSPWTA